MKNPDKYIRQAYLQLLTDLAITAYNKDVPPDVNPLPSDYVLIESQSKTTTERSKTEFEWLCRVTLHIIHISDRGYTATTFVDDTEEQCITAIEAGFDVPFFYLKSISLIDSINLDLTDKTNTIERRVLIYEHWVSEKPIVANSALPYTLPFILTA